MNEFRLDQIGFGGFAVAQMSVMNIAKRSHDSFRKNDAKEEKKIENDRGCNDR